MHGNTKLKLKNSGWISGMAQEFFLTHIVQTVSAAPQTLNEWVPEAPSLQIKRLRCDALSGAENRNEWPYTSTPQSAFMACTGKTFRNSFSVNAIQ